MCFSDPRLQTADLVVSTGLAKVGYAYVNMDDCWEAPERVNGSLAANPQTFPSGLLALSGYVHGKGLHFGIYSSAGNYTCQHRPASLFHEVADAQFFARFALNGSMEKWASERESKR